MLSPTEAFAELTDVFDAWKAEPNQSWQAVPYGLKRCIYSIQSSVLRPDLLRHPEIQEFKDCFDTFWSSYSQQRSYRDKLEHFQRNERPLELAAGAAKVVMHEYYRNALFAHVSRSINDDSPNKSAFNKIHKESAELGAQLSAEARDLAQVVSDLEVSLDSCSGNFYLERALRQEKRQFFVATVISGAVKAPVPREMNGRSIQYPGPISWVEKSKKNKKTRRSAAPNPDAEASLAMYCYRHWGVENQLAVVHHKIPSQVVIWKVKAWDMEQARQIALDKAETFMDRINAEHRVSTFGVKRKVLIWDPDSGRVEHMADTTVPVFETRVMEKSASPSVQRAMRFASKAAGERAGSLKTFYCWAALEYLGRGDADLTPQNFVAKYVPRVMGLVAIHHTATTAWFLIKEEMARQGRDRESYQFLDEWISRNSKKSHLIDLRKFLQLLTDRPNAGLSQGAQMKFERACDELTQIIEGMPDYPKHHIERLRSFLLNPEIFAEHLNDIATASDVTLQRMRFVRNQTAHSAFEESQRYAVLSRSALEVLDTAFQVVNPYTGAPSGALRELAQKFDRVLAELRRGDSSTAYDPDSLLKPDR